MYYTIHHTTRFHYSAPISESIVEVRSHPRSEGNQHCLDFRLRTNPRAHIMSYRGEFGNWVHHFDIPNSHSQLTITTESLVDIAGPPLLPEALDESAWDELDAQTANDEYWETLESSHFARPSELLAELARELDVQRRSDPLTLLRALNSAIYQTFDYSPRTTRVDSPIDEALCLRKGVCQDFAHIMIALVRQLCIPCRYVSGYLCQQGRGLERVPDSAMHAWVEAYLPGYGWVGFDPTNDALADERHVRVAIGRDYADVAPTRGIFRGQAESELVVAVRVVPAQNTFAMELPSEPAWGASTTSAEDDQDQAQAIQIQQQQQQQ
jgi:transglutaminase-like putative cysteine protease